MLIAEINFGLKLVKFKPMLIAEINFGLKLVKF